MKKLIAQIIAVIAMIGMSTANPAKPAETPVIGPTSTVIETVKEEPSEAEETQTAPFMAVTEESETKPAKTEPVITKSKQETKPQTEKSKEQEKKTPLAETEKVICFWITMMALSVAFRITYNDDDAEPLDIFLSKGVYDAFIILSIIGAVSSTLGYVCFAKTSNLFIPNKKTQILKVILYSICLSDNALYYALLVSLFVIRKDTIVLSMLSVWLLLFLLSLVFCFIIIFQQRSVKQEQKRLEYIHK